MKQQLQQIRGKLGPIADGDWDNEMYVIDRAKQALTALAELERMAGEPVLFIHPITFNMDIAHVCAWKPGHELEGYVPLYRAAPPAQQTVTNDEQASAYMDARLWEFIDMAGAWPTAKPDPRIWAHVMVYEPPAQQPQYEAGDMASAHNDGFRAGVESVAQQPQEEHLTITWDEHQTRILAVTMQDEDGRILKALAEAPSQQPQARPDFTDEWTGYLKDGETPFERFLRERKDLTSLTKLYQRTLEENEQLKAQQAQPTDLQSIEQYRMQMAGISTAALGYWKEGDSTHPDYDTVALRDVAKLYAKYEELYRKQAQAEEAMDAAIDAAIAAQGEKP